MKTESKSHNSGMGLAAGVGLFGAWYFLLYPLVKMQFVQSDTFWLIETGRRILQDHAVPAHDPYNFTAPDAHWTVYQWLSEVVFGAVNGIAGLSGVAIMGEAILGILFCVLIFRRLLVDGANSIASVASIFFVVYAVYWDISALRPQLFSFILFWLLTRVCADAISTLALKKSVIFAFIIGVIWTNCHVSFPIGGAILAVHLGVSIVLFVAKISDKRRPILFASMLAAFALSTLLTPQGISLWYFIGSFHTMYLTQEVYPLDWSNKPLLMSLAACVIASCIVLRRKVDPANFLILLALLLAGCKFQRLIVYFCIASCPVLAQALTSIVGTRLKQGVFGSFEDAIKAIVSRWLYVVGVLALAALSVVTQPMYIPRSIPLQAAEYLAAHPIAGNMFCTAHSGSYFIYRFRGALPVFIDTRVDLYDGDFCSRFVAAVKYGEAWESLFAQYKIVAALLPNGSALQLVIDQRSDWRQIYRDGDFTLYVRQ